MRGIEDVRILHPHGHERSDVEEAPVVQLLIRHLPVGKAVVLTIKQFGKAQALRSSPHRKHVIEVPQYLAGAFAALGCVLHGELSGGQHRPDPLAQNRHEHSTGGEIHVEPGGIGRFGAVLQHRPECTVEVGGSGDGHVVRHDVEHDAQIVSAGNGDQALQPLAAAHHVADSAVVDHVIAVR